MDIDAIEVRTRRLKRADSHWRTASYAASDVIGVYVAIRAGGTVGVGATSAHPRRISAETLVTQLSGPLASALVGQPLHRARQLITSLPLGLHPRSAIAVDLALYDLFGRLAGLPAEVMWGGALRDRVDVVRMVGIKKPDEIMDAVRPLYDAGLRAFKLKAGAGVASDVDCVRRVRSEFDGVTLMVDANGSYDLDDATSLCNDLADLDVLCVEQPMPYDDLDGMATLCRRSPVPLMADQLVETTTDAVRVGRAKAADLVSLKLTKMGSVVECLRVAHVCAAMGLGVHLGGSASPSIVDSALTRLALASSDIDRFAEVGESAGLIDDDASGVEYEGAWASSDGQPGLGGLPSIFDA
jgi:L-alanine-DL-glutamate epimerase-like enolase superfamily enzyme